MLNTLAGCWPRKITTRFILFPRVAFYQHSPYLYHSRTVRGAINPLCSSLSNTGETSPETVLLCPTADLLLVFLSFHSTQYSSSFGKFVEWLTRGPGTTFFHPLSLRMKELWLIWTPPVRLKCRGCLLTISLLMSFINAVGILLLSCFRTRDFCVMFCFAELDILCTILGLLK